MENNKRQTAVDYLIKEFSEILGPVSTTPMQDLLMVDAVKKAKEMGKKENMDTYWSGAISGEKENWEQYYNETYEK